MCDYSLEMYGSRPAQEGETLLVNRFPSGSIGFAAPDGLRTPVCIQCDTSLLLTDIPSDVQASFGCGSSEKVKFIRLDEGMYRDGVEFANGLRVSLQRLKPGMAATVMTLITRIEPVAEHGHHHHDHDHDHHHDHPAERALT